MKTLLSFLGGAITYWVATTEEGKAFANKAMTKGFQLIKENLLSNKQEEKENK